MIFDVAPIQKNWVQLSSCSHLRFRGVFGGVRTSTEPSFDLFVAQGAMMPNMQQSKTTSKMLHTEDRQGFTWTTKILAAAKERAPGVIFFLHYTPEKTHMEATKTWRFGRWFSFSKVWCSGDPCSFSGGVKSEPPRNSSAKGNTSTLLIEVAEPKPWKGNIFVDASSCISWVCRVQNDAMVDNERSS